MVAMTPAWLRLAFTQTCEIFARQPAGEDDMGSPVYVTTLVATSACLLSPQSSTEIQFGRTGQTAHTLYLPAETAVWVDAFVRFTIDGLNYEADGPAQLYAPLFMPQLHHVEVSVTGSTS
jgi:hypothetical protein